MTQTEAASSNLPTIRRHLYTKAQNWWLGALGCKFLVYILGVGGILLSPPTWFVPLGVFGLVVLSELCLLRSDHIKGAVEALQRKLELHDGLGWEISPIELSDLAARFPQLFHGQLSTHDADMRYYDSTESVGPKRALDNVEESAYWSKHSAGATTIICFAVMCVLVLLSIGVLLWSLYSPTFAATMPARENTAKVITSTVLLLFSLGLLSITLKYDGFKRRADEIEKNAVSLIKAGDVDDIQAIKTVHEYQLARASAPLIPSYIYEKKRPNLNKSWEIRKKRQP